MSSPSQKQVSSMVLAETTSPPVTSCYFFSLNSQQRPSLEHKTAMLKSITRKISQGKAKVLIFVSCFVCSCLGSSPSEAPIFLKCCTVISPPYLYVRNDEGYISTKSKFFDEVSLSFLPQTAVLSYSHQFFSECTEPYFVFSFVYFLNAFNSECAFWSCDGILPKCHKDGRIPMQT